MPNSVYQKWLTIHKYLSTGTNIYIHPEHNDRMKRFDSLLLNISDMCSKMVYVCVHTASGDWNYSDGTLTLYTSPFDVILVQKKCQISSQHSTIWMKSLLEEILTVIRTENKSVQIIWKDHGEVILYT